MRHFCWLSNNMRAFEILRSNSVTRQVNFNKTKIGEKCQNIKNSNETFWLNFKLYARVRNYLFTLYLTYNQWNFCDHCHIRDKFTHSILTPEFFIMEASIRKVVEQLNLNLKVAEEEKNFDGEGEDVSAARVPAVPQLSYFLSRSFLDVPLVSQSQFCDI